MKTTKSAGSEYASLDKKGVPHIKLTISEIDIAIASGVIRRKECILAGFENCGYGKERSGVWDVDIEGAGAEESFCKNKGLYWGGVVNNFKEADVLNNVQIRHTTRPNGRLIVRPDDNPEHYYVLVVGRIPNFYIVGFIQGKDASQEQFKDAPNSEKPAWFVPQDKLIPIEFLDCSGTSAKVSDGIYIEEKTEKVDDEDEIFDIV